MFENTSQRIAGIQMLLCNSSKVTFFYHTKCSANEMYYLLSVTSSEHFMKRNNYFFGQRYFVVALQQNHHLKLPSNLLETAGQGRCSCSPSCLATLFTWVKENVVSVCSLFISATFLKFIVKRT